MLDKMLTKSNRDVENFTKILLKHQPGIKHYIEEGRHFLDLQIQSKIIYLMIKKITNLNFGKYIFFRNVTKF